MHTSAVTANRGTGWRRRLAVLLAMLVASLGGVAVTTATPAYAATSTTYCFPFFQDGVLIGYYCIEVPFAYDPNPCLCPDFAIDILTNPALETDWQRGYLGEVGRGLGLLGQAAANPREATRLRQQAQAAFVSAGRYLGGVSLSLRQVGIADVAELRLDPSPEPWLVAAGSDLVDGLQLIQLARASSAPAPLLARAMVEFEAAYQQLTAPQLRGY